MKEVDDETLALIDEAIAHATGPSRPQTQSGRGGSAVVLTVCATAKLTTIMMMVER